MTTHSPPLKVIAITGTGGIGLTIARRLGTGRLLLLADFSTPTLQHAADTLRTEGFHVETHEVDVADNPSVTAFAEAAAARGTIEAVVHTAGVSPAQAPPDRVLAVDLVGTAHVIDAFYRVAGPGTSLVCIASIAGHVDLGLSAEMERHLATAPAADLLARDEVRGLGRLTYALAKRANILRVQAAAVAWGRKGARVNTVSPGVVSTAMGRGELSGPAALEMRALVDGAPAQRIGTSEDVARAVAFLASADSSFITGADLLVDGGSVAAQKWGASAGN